MTELPTRSPAAGLPRDRRTWVHLRMCQSCGRIACCDSSPHRTPRHAAARHRSSAPPNPGRLERCYLDNVAFVVAQTMTLPELHLADWRPTKDTLHLYSQILGKIRLATTAPRNHWWNVAALRRRPRSHDPAAASPRHDVRDHARLRRSRPDRADRRRSRRGRSRSATECRSPTSTPASTRMLGELGIDVEIKEQPFGVPMTTPFAQDIEHASWDRDAIERFGRILDWSDSVFEEFSGWFNGKTSPVHLFWHSLDLAVTRFSGRPGAADRRRSASPRRPTPTRSSRSDSGPATTRVGDAAYYSYTAPEPDGLRDQPLSGGRLDRVRLRLAGDPSLRDRAHRPRPQNDAARVLPERLRGRRPPRRLGHHQLRLDLVSHPRPAPPAPRQRRRRPRPHRLRALADTHSTCRPSTVGMVDISDVCRARR